MQLVTSQDPSDKFPVDARQLHLELGSKRKFYDWINYKIKVGGFIDNEDFNSLTQICVKPKIGRPAKDYMLSINMAKHLCQMEGTEKGKQCREYFIKSEEKLQEIKQAEMVPMSEYKVLLSKIDTLEHFISIVAPDSIKEFIANDKLTPVKAHCRKRRKVTISSAKKLAQLKALEDMIEYYNYQPDLFEYFNVPVIINNHYHIAGQS